MLCPADVSVLKVLNVLYNLAQIILVWLFIIKIPSAETLKSPCHSGRSSLKLMSSDVGTSGLGFGCCTLPLQKTAEMGQIKPEILIMASKVFSSTEHPQCLVLQWTNSITCAIKDLEYRKCHNSQVRLVFPQMGELKLPDKSPQGMTVVPLSLVDWQQTHMITCHCGCWRTCTALTPLCRQPDGSVAFLF